MRQRQNQQSDATPAQDSLAPEQGAAQQQGMGNAALLARLGGDTAGPFAGPVNQALSAAFGQSLAGLSLQTDSAGVGALDSVAFTEGTDMTFGGGFSAELADAEAMGVAAHEVAHGLAGGGSGQTALDQPGDPGELAAEQAEQRFADWVRGGMRGTPPQLSPARGGQARIHRKSTGAQWSGSPVLRFGTRSAAVRALQAQLNASGARLPTTGYFGNMTLSALRDFQRRNGLEVDGVAGPATAAALGRGGGGGANASDWAGRPSLELGASGASVRSLQTQLNARGAGLEVTGTFDQPTLAAVRAAQQAAGLEVDGVAGPATHRALTQVHIDAQRSDDHRNTCGVTGSPVLEFGQRSPQVVELQKLLNQNGANLPATGYFGPMTKAAVLAFQRAQGLEADGVVGPKTAQALASCSGGDDAKQDQTQDTGKDEGKDTDSTQQAGGGGGAGAVGNADPKGVLTDPNLHPEVRKMAGEVVRKVQGEGLNPYVFEGYRSFSRQNALFNKGGVTKVRGGGSFHNYGLAVDIVFYNSRGTGPSWDAPSSSWQTLGRHGKAAGFTEWGGDWGWDMPHLEYHPGHDGSAYAFQQLYYRGGLSAVWESLGTDLSHIQAATTWDGVLAGEITLRDGVDGQAVSTLQEKLNAHGAGLKVDGDFGSGTEAAVRSFQQATGSRSRASSTRPRRASWAERGSATPPSQSSGETQQREAQQGEGQPAG